MIKREWIAAAAAGLVLVLTASVSVAEDDPAESFRRSVELETKGKYDDALKALDNVVGVQANSYMYHLRKGWLLYLLTRHDEAIGAYDRAVALESKAVEPLLGRMLPELAARKWLDAVKTGRSVLQLDGDNYLAQSRIAYAYYSLGRYGAAEQTYKAVLALYPGDIDMRSGYAWSLFKQGQHAAAKKQFKAILQVSPRHSAALEGINLCP